MKFFVAFIMCALSFGCASSPSKVSCGESIYIRYDGIRRLNSADAIRSFGSFLLLNKSKENVNIPLDDSYYPMQVHGEYVELQSRYIDSNALWAADSVLVGEYSQSKKWLIVGPGGGSEFFIDLTGPIIDIYRSKNREYRVSLKAESGCQYFSNSFRISNV